MKNIMKAEMFDWDPLFLAAIDFKPKNPSAVCKIQSEETAGKATKITTTIETPYGDLVKVESENYGTRGLVKDFLDTEEDYKKMMWYSRERNYYNELCPDIFETLSEPPVGNLPSLKWGRERLDKKIITKGNISLDLMLNGTPEQVREQVRRVKSETIGYRHIVGLSDNILDSTPAENLKAYVEECRK